MHHTFNDFIKLLQVEHPLSEMLGTGSVSATKFFLDFGILAYYNEISWGWEPNQNVKSI
jgi:hypothetical protein